MKTLLVAMLLFAAGGAAPAAAQDLGGFAGVLAGAVEGFGQTLGEAMTNGQSVFVTAHGAAKLPSPLSGSYFVNVEAAAARAVDAGKAEEAKLDRLKDVARTFGVEMTPGETRFSLQADLAEQNRRVRENIAANAGRPGTFVSPSLADVPRLFHAQTGVRFTAPSGPRTAAFLDAVRAAGVEEISGDLTTRPGAAGGFVQQASEILGFGAVQKIDDAVWRAAEADAVANARKEAEALAAAAGRRVLEARSVMLLTRTITGGEAVVTVAARFGFAN